MIDAGLYITYALIGITILLILVFAIVRIAKNPKGAVSVLIGIAGLAVLLGIAYGLSTGADAEALETTKSTSHWVGTGLIVLYILGTLTVLSILYSEVTRLFK